jgi:hypothetical protein
MSAQRGFEARNTVFGARSTVYSMEGACCAALRSSCIFSISHIERSIEKTQGCARQAGSVSLACRMFDEVKERLDGQPEVAVERALFS